MLKKFYLCCAISLLLLANHAFAQEGSSMKIDNYQVHYSAFNTSFLSAEVAKAYGINRSGAEALLNIAILEKQADGSMKNVTAEVRGTLSDLIHKKPLAFKEVREQEAIYYLASFPIEHKATAYFSISAKVANRLTPLKIEFTKQLYKDE